ncbi:hypothetical protein I4U23_013154 [Adineta vaga]|nr:hypothetical protein I4U23_013154 [Adineta vaga]
MALFPQTSSYGKMNRSVSVEESITFIIQLTNSIFPLLILPVATIGNSLCFLVFCRPKFQKRLTRTSSICIRLLCINDSILLYLFIIDIFLKVYIKPSVRIYSTPTGCRLYKCIRYSILDFSAYLQLGLTTDRFICCVYHTYYTRWRKRNYLFYLLAFAFVCIFAKNSSFLSSSYGYYSINSINRTTVRCSVKIKAIYFTMYMAYGQSLIDMVFVTCLPFFLILYFNSRILRQVVRLRTECWNTFTRIMHIAPIRSESSFSISTNIPKFSTTNTTLIITTHRARHRRLHLTFALGCISFIFIFSTAPYKIFKIVERHDKVVRDQYKYGAIKSIHIRFAEMIIDCFVYLSCSTPFFVCFATSSIFRDELRKVFHLVRWPLLSYSRFPLNRTEQPGESWCRETDIITLLQNKYIHASAWISEHSYIVTEFNLAFFNDQNKQLCVINEHQFTSAPTQCGEDIIITKHRCSISIEYRTKNIIVHIGRTASSSGKHDHFYTIWVWQNLCLIKMSDGLCKTSCQPKNCGTTKYEAKISKPSAKKICQIYTSKIAGNLRASSEDSGILSRINNSIQNAYNACIIDLEITGNLEFGKAGVEMLVVNSMTINISSTNSFVSILNQAKTIAKQAIMRSNLEIKRIMNSTSLLDSPLIKSGQKFGGNDGTFFQDFSSPNYLRGIINYLGKNHIEAIQFLYSNPSYPDKVHETAIHGDTVGAERKEEFYLEKDEKINKIQVTYVDDVAEEPWLQDIRFFTTHGRSSSSISTVDRTLFTEEFDGYTVGYVSGMAGGWVNQIQFYWYKEDSKLQ